MPDCLPHEHPLAMLRMFDPNALPLTESSEKEKAGDRSSKRKKPPPFSPSLQRPFAALPTEGDHVRTGNAVGIPLPLRR